MDKKLSIILLLIVLIGGGLTLHFANNLGRTSQFNLAFTSGFYSYISLIVTLVALVVTLMVAWAGVIKRQELFNSNKRLSVWSLELITIVILASIVYFFH